MKSCRIVDALETLARLSAPHASTLTKYASSATFVNSVYTHYIVHRVYLNIQSTQYSSNDIIRKRQLSLTYIRYKDN